MGRFDKLTTLDTTPVQPVLSQAPMQPQNSPALSPLAKKEEADKPANLQAGKQVNLQTRKPASRQADKQTNLQAGKQVNLHTGKQVFIEKYSSYLTREYKKELKRIAWESDRNEYEVLIEVVEYYVTHHKQAK